MSELKKRDVVALAGGDTCQVVRELGRGGQGIVYAVNYNGSEYALKWYTQKVSERFRENLKRNANRQTPNEHFIWPMAVAEDVPQFVDGIGTFLAIFGVLGEVNEVHDFVCGGVGVHHGRLLG